MKMAGLSRAAYSVCQDEQGCWRSGWRAVCHTEEWELKVLMFRTKIYWQNSVRDDCSPLAALDQFQLALTALYFLEPLINPQRK